MTDARLWGRWGEAQAAEYLRKKGCRILGMNYRTRLGELDIIAADKRFVLFVEVKLRRDARFAQAREFVTKSKQARLIAAAQEWLQANPTTLQPRFDVMELYAPAGRTDCAPVINHIENAFDAT